MTQSDVASSLEAETAVAAFKQQIETVWNYLAPPRVIVSVVWQTDRLKRYQVESFRELSLGISRVQQDQKMVSGPDGAQPIASEEEEQTFTRGEIRGLFEEYIGIEIPELGDDESVESDKKTGDEVGERFVEAFDGQSLALLKEEYGADRVYQVGLSVGLLGTGRYGTIIGWNGKTDWVWVQTNNGHVMLVDGSRLCLGQVVPRVSLDVALRIRRGLAEFKPKGKPLDPATDVELEPEAAVESARDVWTAIAPDDLEDLL
jgi:hypothetical protein